MRSWRAQSGTASRTCGLTVWVRASVKRCFEILEVKTHGAVQPLVDERRAHG